MILFRKTSVAAVNTPEEFEFHTIDTIPTLPRKIMETTRRLGSGE
jgi:hypothetical protein